MVRIRLVRLGVKGKIFYRIIAVDKKRKRGGAVLDIIGYWHPAKSLKFIEEKKMKEWLQKGAKLSKAVKELTAKI